MKQERHATTLAEDLQEASANTAEYGEFFTGLTGITDRKPVDDALGERIQGYVLGWLEGHPLTAFDDYSATAYRRTYLGRSPETGWEAIVMSWQEGNRTSIHAHPQFAGYHFADGGSGLEIFEPAGDGTARPVHSAEVEAPCAFFAIGKPGCFDKPHTPHHLPEPHGAQPARLFGRRTPRRGYTAKRMNKPRTFLPPPAPPQERPQPPHGNHGSRGNR